MVTGCGQSPSSRPQPIDAELLVAAAALSDFVGHPDSATVLLLFKELEGRTEQFPDSLAWTAAMDSFGLKRAQYPTLVGSYWNANRHPRPLRRPLPVPNWRVRLVGEPSDASSSDIETIHHVSRVGFTTTGDSALVAVDAHCGLLCGRGILALYVRAETGWRLAVILQALLY